MMQILNHGDKMTVDFYTKIATRNFVRRGIFGKNRFTNFRYSFGHCGFKSPALGNITSFLNLKKESNRDYKSILPLGLSG
jgi:hypothetical protein